VCNRPLHRDEQLVAQAVGVKVPPDGQPRLHRQSSQAPGPPAWRSRGPARGALRAPLAQRPPLRTGHHASPPRRPGSPGNTGAATTSRPPAPPPRTRPRHVAPLTRARPYARPSPRSRPYTRPCLTAPPAHPATHLIALPRSLAVRPSLLVASLLLCRCRSSVLFCSCSPASSRLFSTWSCPLRLASLLLNPEDRIRPPQIKYEVHVDRGWSDSRRR